MRSATSNRRKEVLPTRPSYNCNVMKHSEHSFRYLSSCDSFTAPLTSTICPPSPHSPSTTQQTLRLSPTFTMPSSFPEIPTGKIPHHVTQYFNQFPWTANILSDPALLPLPLESTSRYTYGTHHTYFGKTMATNETILAYQPFYHAKPVSPPNTSTRSPIPRDIAGITEITVLLSIGSGLNGHGGIAHGGFISSILDDTMGLIVRNQPEAMIALTVQLEVRYHAPLMTPAVLCCRSWTRKREGKKMWVESVLEDRNGKKFASGESLFVYGKAKI